ncbi:MAG: imidazole glycerol phosphate synthase subunit HisH [Gammaproteobacteria bacterium]|nr:imidazole glycerol phosphate synthase subunit HisH [Gammaproteobacteria bacterium]
MSWSSLVPDAIVIVDYDAGNLKSVQRACAEVGVTAAISNDPDRVRRAERVIFPGVGAAGSAMRSLIKTGLDAALKEAILAGTPVLGICLGLQISLDHSEENDTSTLGLIAGRVRRFQFDDPELKIPHMGWNEVRPVAAHPLLAGIEPGDEFYFVHGYYPAPIEQHHVYAVTDYEHDFACALGKDNYFATQFHPEKSGRVGLRLMEQFTCWNGSC